MARALFIVALLLVAVAVAPFAQARNVVTEKKPAADCADSPAPAADAPTEEPAASEPSPADAPAEESAASEPSPADAPAEEPAASEPSPAEAPEPSTSD